MKPNPSVLISGASTTRQRLPGPAVAAAWTGLLLVGAIFGFFYAWVCSTMWGLDKADPRVAIAAMQAMNESVRNGVFLPAFFLTPVVLGVAAALALRERRHRAAWLLAAGAVVYLVGGLLLTMLVNVPMNEALAELAVPADRTEASRIWGDYSTRWQRYNQLRTVMSGIALGLTGAALLVLHRQREHTLKRR